MSNYISKIKEIPDIPKKIFDAASNGRLVLFIGAGVSRILGCPSWQELAVKLLEKLYKDRKIDFYAYTRLKSLDAKKILTICEKLYEENGISFNDTIKSLLNGDEDIKQKFGEIYKNLYNFNAIFITTNYDNFLDREAKNSSNNVFIINTKEDLLLTYLDSGNVIHLHGSVEKLETMVVTVSDYLQFYQSQKVKEFLNEVFSKHTVLFVGYGLEEYEVLEFIIKSSMNTKNGNEKEIRHYMLYPMFDNESELLQFLEIYYGSLNISIIPYSIRKGYENLVEVIKKWSKEIGSIARSKPFLEKIKLIDEVVK